MKRMILPFIYAVAAYMGCVTRSYCQSGPSVLSALQARGVVDVVHGSNTALYAGFLVKTGSSGLIDASLLPELSTGGSVKYTQMVFVDGSTGSDEDPYDGSPARPYASLSKALSESGPVSIVVLMPGIYSAVPVTNKTDLTLVGNSALLSSVTGTLDISTTNASAIRLVDLSVGAVRRTSEQHTTVHMLGQSYAGQISTQYPESISSELMVYMDPVSSLGTPLASTAYQIFRHYADSLGFTPVVDDWGWTNTTPNTVHSALTLLGKRPRYDAGAAVGDLMRWDGSKWTRIPAGGDYDVLWGGTNPLFRAAIYWSEGTNDILGSGTADGQIMYWDATSEHWEQLDRGIEGQFLRIGAAFPQWVDVETYYPTNHPTWAQVTNIAEAVVSAATTDDTPNLPWESIVYTNTPAYTDTVARAASAVQATDPVYLAAITLADGAIQGNATNSYPTGRLRLVYGVEVGPDDTVATALDVSASGTGMRWRMDHINAVFNRRALVAGSDTETLLAYYTSFGGHNVAVAETHGALRYRHMGEWIESLRWDSSGVSLQGTNVMAAITAKAEASRAITINGVTLDLSADRAWTIATVERGLYVNLVEPLVYDAEGSNLHFQVEWSASPSFSAATSYSTTNSQSEWMYFNGSEYAAFPAAGLPSTAYGTGFLSSVVFAPTNKLSGPVFIRARAFDGQDWSDYRAAYGSDTVRLGN